METNELTDTAAFKPFAINTYGYKTFTNEDGEKVDYLEIQIFNTDNKQKSQQGFSSSKDKPKNK